MWVGQRVAVARRGPAQRLRRAGADRHGRGRAAGRRRRPGPGARAGARRARPTCTRASTGGSSSSTSTAGVARVEPDDGATYTVPAQRHRRSGCSRSTPSARWARPGCTSASAEVHTTVVGYQRKDALTGALVHTRGARPADLHAGHPGDLVRRRARRSWTRPGVDRAASAGRAPRHRARRHRDAAAVRDLRPVGRRRRVHRPPGRHRAAHHRRSTTPCPAEPGWPSSGFEAADRHLRATFESVARLRVQRGLPVVRPVAEVRQRQRPPRQGGRRSHLLRVLLDG